MGEGLKMTFSEYETGALSTAVYPRIGSNYSYPALGLAGEAGEVANKVKKIERDDAGFITEDRRKQVSKELGGVLWYVAMVCFEFGLDMEAVAADNLAQLKSRQDRGVLKGSGDDR